MGDQLRRWSRCKRNSNPTRSAAARSDNLRRSDFAPASAAVGVHHLQRLDTTPKVCLPASQLRQPPNRGCLEHVHAVGPANQAPRKENTMTWDLLLYWMTHSAEGSWSGFRKAVSEIAPNSLPEDQAGLARRLRVTLSDLGHVDFFMEGSQRWRVLPPMLAGLGIDDSAAVLCGSRTP